MPSMSSPRMQSSWWLGGCWPIIVSFFTCPFCVILIFQSGFYILSILLLTATLSWKGRNNISVMWSLCLDGGLMFPKFPIKPILQIMWTNQRFVSNHYLLILTISLNFWQINTCESQHDALVQAATRSSAGYAFSGVVAVICSRHCLICRNGAGDLVKGEK